MIHSIRTQSAEIQTTDFLHCLPIQLLERQQCTRRTRIASVVPTRVPAGDDDDIAMRRTANNNSSVTDLQGTRVRVGDRSFVDALGVGSTTEIFALGLLKRG